MKKLFFLALVLVCLVMIIVAADFRAISGMAEQAPIRKNCGYTIIEFDKGIDCYGDTIQLVRKNGFAERVIPAHIVSIGF